MVSPYDLNPMGKNPLREILAETIDFDRVARATTKLLSPLPMFGPVSWSRVQEQCHYAGRSARLGLSAHHVSAVEINNSYWDGGYSGNPTITPLIQECKSQDTILVQIDPVGQKSRTRLRRFSIG